MGMDTRRALTAAALLASLTGCTLPLALDCATSDKTPPGSPHREYPISLAYEDNGARRQITDTLICDYRPPRCTAAGPMGTWSSSYRSGGEHTLRTLPDGTRYLWSAPSCDAVRATPVTPGLLTDVQNRVYRRGPAGDAYVRLGDELLAHGIRMLEVEVGSELPAPLVE